MNKHWDTGLGEDESKIEPASRTLWIPILFALLMIACAIYLGRDALFGYFNFWEGKRAEVSIAADAPTSDELIAAANKALTEEELKQKAIQEEQQRVMAMLEAHRVRTNANQSLPEPIFMPAAPSTTETSGIDAIQTALGAIKEANDINVNTIDFLKKELEKKTRQSIWQVLITIISASGTIVTTFVNVKRYQREVKKDGKEIK